MRRSANRKRNPSNSIERILYNSLIAKRKLIVTNIYNLLNSEQINEKLFVLSFCLYKMDYFDNFPKVNAKMERPNKSKYVNITQNGFYKN